MALKKFKPNTPGQRGLVLVDRSDLWKGKPEKSLTEGLHSKGGRNNNGRITARRRGGGHKQRYRMIDFKRLKYDVEGTVERIEYDPNRTAFIALIRYPDDEVVTSSLHSVSNQVIKLFLATLVILSLATRCQCKISQLARLSTMWK